MLCAASVTTLPPLRLDQCGPTNAAGPSAEGRVPKWAALFQRVHAATQKRFTVAWAEELSEVQSGGSTDFPEWECEEVSAGVVAIEEGVRRKTDPSSAELRTPSG